jgi:hypothetical protein
VGAGELRTARAERARSSGDSPSAAAAEAVDKVAAARVWLLKEKPFFGACISAFTGLPSIVRSASTMSILEL